MTHVDDAQTLRTLYQTFRKLAYAPPTSHLQSWGLQMAREVKEEMRSRGIWHHDLTKQKQLPPTTTDTE